MSEQGTERQAGTGPGVAGGILLDDIRWLAACLHTAKQATGGSPRQIYPHDLANVQFEQIPQQERAQYLQEAQAAITALPQLIERIVTRSGVVMTGRT